MADNKITIRVNVRFLCVFSIFVLLGFIGIFFVYKTRSADEAFGSAVGFLVCSVVVVIFARRDWFRSYVFSRDEITVFYKKEVVMRLKWSDIMSTTGWLSGSVCQTHSAMEPLRWVTYHDLSRIFMILNSEKNSMGDGMTPEKKKREK